ncbi:MAG TPA: TetR/AcrR family transcriptional regulator [Myxococcota bacterium]|nr:TetR/AcrR family transcriptional regulator [Myxococcota bacterium]HQK51156.1 TetR/AcrR family transcriptional regulator [Myxococcota bacterium]
MGRMPLSPEARQKVRDRLLDAAARVFESRGYRSARIEDIARGAGVAVGTVYKYFPGKADLILELQYRRLVAVCEEVEALARREGAFCDKVRTYVERFVAFGAESRGFFETLRESPQFVQESVAAHGDKVRRMHEVLDRIMGELATLMEQGIREGTLRPQSPEDLAQALLGLARGLTLRRFRQSRDLEDLSARILDLFLHGAASRTGGPGAPCEGGPA